LTGPGEKWEVFCLCLDVGVWLWRLAAVPRLHPILRNGVGRQQEEEANIGVSEEREGTGEGGGARGERKARKPTAETGRRDLAAA